MNEASESLPLSVRRGSILGKRLGPMGGLMYEAPKITDYGSIAEHTFTNELSIVPGVGPKGKNPDTSLIPDKFSEPSHS